MCAYIAAFLAFLTAVYWFLSYEQAGTTMLLLSGGAWAFLWGYLLLQARRIRGTRPEDDDAAELRDGAGAVGFFPVTSVWPFGLGMGLVTIGNGIVFGVWFIAVGAILTGASVIGYALESQRRA